MGEYLCKKCHEMNNFKFDFCCSFECFEHEFCKECIHYSTNIPAEPLCKKMLDRRIYINGLKEN